MKFLSEKLKKLVEEDQRSGKDIAQFGGFSASALSQWASGQRTPGAEELADLAKAFHVPLHYFFEGMTPTEFIVREVPAEYLVDEVIAEAENLREIAKRLEMKARKLKSKPPLTPEQKGIATDIGRRIAKTGDEIANEMAKKGIKAGDRKEVE